MNKLHSVLIVGVGSIGERHLRCFQRTTRADASICEPNASLRSQVADRYQIAAAHASLDEIDFSGIDAAVIATPAPTHVPIALQMANRGIHLLIEKPLSTSPDKLNELQVAVKQRSIVAGVAYVLRFHPALRSMRAAIAGGEFGKPLEIVATAGQNFPFYRPAYRDTYYTKHSTGGGAIQDALTHVVNAVEWLVGPMTRVIADAAHLALLGVEVEDTVHAIARHGDVLASYALNQHQAPNESSISVICERGVARFQVHERSYACVSTPESPWQVQRYDDLERDDLFEAQAEAFLDSISGKSTFPCSLGDAASTLRSNLAILQAAAHTAWTEV